MPTGLSPLERVVAWLLLGTAIVSVTSLLLADLGLFTGWAVAGAVLLAGAGVLLAGRRRRDAGGGLPRRSLRRDAVLVALVALLLALALPPFEWVLGGRDPGTYVNAALQMRAEHSTIAHRPELRALPPGVVGDVSLWEPDPIEGRAPPAPPADPYRRDLWPGMYLQRPDGVVPQGFHLFPALLAAAGSVSGDEGLWAVPALAVLVLLVCALLAGRLTEGRRPGVAEAATGAALVASLAFVWYARYPTAELLDAALLVGGAWLWTIAARSGSGWTAGAAGFVTGASLLTRPDAVLTVAAVGALALVLGVLGAFGPQARRFTVWFAVVAGASLVHATVFAGRYLEDVSVHAPAGWAALAAGGAVVVVAAALALHRRRDLAALIRSRSSSLTRALPAAALLGLLALAALGVVRGWLPPSWLRWHLGEAGIALAVAGGAVVLARLPRERGSEGAWLLLLLAAATLLLYLPDARISPDQPWGFRRFLPVLVPVWAVLCGVAAAALAAVRGRWRTPARVALTVVGAVALVQLVGGLAPTLGHREYEGAGEVVDRLDASLGPGRPLVLFGPHDVTLHRFGPAVGIGRGREAFPVRALNRRPLVDWVTARAKGGRVLLVTYRRRLPPLDRGRLRASPIATVPFSLPEMEQPLDRLPRHPRRLAGELVVWRIVARSERAGAGYGRRARRAGGSPAARRGGAARAGRQVAAAATSR